MITCRELTEFLDDYIDQGLSAETHAVFEKHLSLCPPCIRYVESYRTTVALTRGLGRAGPTPASTGDDEATVSDMPEKLIQAILNARRVDSGQTGPKADT